MSYQSFSLAAQEYFKLRMDDKMGPIVPLFDSVNAVDKFFYICSDYNFVALEVIHLPRSLQEKFRDYVLFSFEDLVTISMFTRGLVPSSRMLMLWNAAFLRKFISQIRVEIYKPYGQVCVFYNSEIINHHMLNYPLEWFKRIRWKL